MALNAESRKRVAAFVAQLAFRLSTETEHRQHPPITFSHPHESVRIPMVGVSAQEEREMWSRQRLLKIRGPAVDSNFSIRKAITRAWTAPLPRLAFGHRRTLPISNAELRDERKCGSRSQGEANACGTTCGATFRLTHVANGRSDIAPVNVLNTRSV